MNFKLTQNQLDYVLFHLAFVFEIDSSLREKIIYGSDEKGKISFLQNDKKFDIKKLLWKDNTPILFPGNAEAPFYTLEQGSLVFHHDLLRSAFYLLSGKQEYDSAKKDKIGRFSYEFSIQKKLNIIYRPVVNEYFDIIAKAVEEYCLFHKLPFKRKRFSENFIFFLTHDVDRVDKYHFATVKNKFKKAGLLKGLIWLWRWFNPFYRHNPYWSFDYLKKTEKDRGFLSTYYFLNKDVKHIDSYYRFKDKRIRDLMETLFLSGHDIGLHGGIKTYNSVDLIKKNKVELERASGKTLLGNRQHWLMFETPLTMKCLSENDFRYDTSLGFAEHEGFRNSYCLPFKLYDFEQDRMIDVWEFPLMVMDTTLFNYRKLDFNSAIEVVKVIIDEVEKYHGMFTLLVHPDAVDEEERPGIRAYYERLLDEFKSKNVDNLTGEQLLDLMGELL